MAPLMDDSDDEGALGAVISEFLEARCTGRRPDRSAIRMAHSELALDLDRFFAAHDAVERLARPLREVAQAARVTVNDGERSLRDGPLAAPLQFGEYRLLEVLGSGGMGIVYRAHHSELKRDVALKQIITGPLATEADVRRFRNEAESAAKLEHANIVPVHEVGEQDGRHYLTMRLMEGGSLATHLHDYQSDPHAAARLVATVAHAVHHAHQRGILHRDLKPSNVLLDGAGTPHVTDFGLARRIGDESTLTESGAIFGTPAYMSPEQATGRVKEVTTATDVYGLGAILYALLTGQPPFRGDSVLETLERVRSYDPESPRRLNPRVDRDLETIVLKAIAKEPGARYETALEMANDLDNWLTGEPILARPVGSMVKAWRSARRNRAVASALGICAIVFVLAGIWTVRERSEALRQKAIAIQERDRALSNERIATDVIDEYVTENARENFEDQPREERNLRNQFKRATQYYEAMTRQGNAGPYTREKAAHAHTYLGQIHLLLGELAPAEQSYRTGLAIFEALAGDDPRAPAYERGRLEAMLGLGKVLLRVMDPARRSEAEKLYRRAIDLRVAPSSLSGDDRPAQYSLARAYLGLSGVVELDGHASDAVGFAQKSIELTRALCERFPDEPLYREHAARSQQSLAAVYYHLGRKRDALRLYHDTIATYDVLLTARPGDPRYRGGKAAALHGLALTSHDLQDLKTVESSYRAAIGLHEKLAEEYPAVPEHRLHLAKHHAMLAQILAAADPQAAEMSLRESVRIASTLVRDFPGTAEYQLLRADCRINLSGPLLGNGHRGEAESVLRESISDLEGMQTRFGTRADFQATWAMTARNLGEVLHRRGDDASATTALEQAVARQREALQLSRDHPMQYERLLRIADAYAEHLFAMNQSEEALRQIERMSQPPAYDPMNYFHLAIFLGGWSARMLPGSALKYPGQERQELAQVYAGQAVENLRKALDAGFKDAALFNRQTSFDCLRDRADFKAIVRDLKNKQVPSPGK
jgi:tetratricopeptide (TPR) repeat protein